MKFPLSWLQEYISLSHSPEKISETLTGAGLEVDSMEFIGSSFEGVVVAEILEANPHPNADRLRVAKVFDGTETLQIVCGAPNCRAGIKVALAKIGAVLQDEKGPWKIKKGKLRDVESFGMLCSSSELGLPSESDSGILELPSSLALGTDVSSLYADVIFSLSITPNLGHCLSLYGIARELSALLEVPLNPLSYKTSNPTEKEVGIEIAIENSSLCPQYGCKRVSNIHVGPSPDWLKNRLEQAGIRSINNVVDVSNYVMLATGQPLHFFDLDALHTPKLFIRPLAEATKVVTLDGVERTVPAETVVIADEKSTVAIAGIMGCLRGHVTESTKNILIEAAVFNPSSIRKSSKDLQLKTDASYRFERGVDPKSLSNALEMAAALLEQVAGAKASYPSLLLSPHPIADKKIICNRKKVQNLLGIKLSISEISHLLARLEIKTLSYNEESLTLSIPTYRNDISQEVDIIEEIVKLYGFNNLPKSAARYTTSRLEDDPMFSLEKRVRTLLLEEGLQEFLTCDLISPPLADLLGRKEEVQAHCINVLHAKSQDYSILRPSLMPGLLQVVKHNLDHQNNSIFGFEVGRVHFTEKETFQEHASIGIILSGNKDPYHHNPKPRELDFFDLKGIVENLLDHLKIRQASFEPSHFPYFQMGRQAIVKVEGKIIGMLGEIHPLTLKTIDISQRTYFAELNVAMLAPFVHKKITVKELSIFPSSERDWTVTVTKQTPIQEVLSCIQELAPPLLDKVFLLDVFESEKLGLDRKNITWRFTYKDTEKTIDAQTVERVHTTLLQKVAQKLENCIL